MRDERGDIIVGWLTKLAVAITLIGVTGFDAISVATTKMSATDTADQAAREGSDMWAESHGNIQRSYDAARRYAEQHGATIDPADFRVEADGTVRVHLKKTATTLVFYRIGATKKWAHVEADGYGKSV
jgi:hypothetical protein